MNKLIAVVAALCLTVAAAPATAITPEPEPRLEAAKAKKKKKRKKQRPRYRISINFAATNVSTETCLDGEYTIKESGHFTTNWSQTGTYPGSSRRTGYTESWLERESNDPYLPSFKTPPVRKPVEAAFGKSEWDVQINARRTKFSYDWKNAAGGREDTVIDAPRRVGKSVTRKLTSDNTKPGDPSGEPSSRNCTTTVNDTVSHEVIITRVQ